MAFPWNFDDLPYLERIDWWHINPIHNLTGITIRSTRGWATHGLPMSWSHYEHRECDTALNLPPTSFLPYMPPSTRAHAPVTSQAPPQHVQTNGLQKWNLFHFCTRVRFTA